MLNVYGYKREFTLKSLFMEFTNYYSSSSTLPYYISQRSGAISCNAYVGSPKIFIFKAEIKPSSSESIRVKIYLNECFFIYSYIVSEV